MAASHKRGQNITNLITDAMSDGYPQSLQIGVASKNRNLFVQKFGPRYKYWDVGSLTKILVTTPLMMKLVAEKRIRLSDALSKHLPIFENTRIGKIHIENLLSHASGLKWWRPYYKELTKHSWSDRERILKKCFQKETVTSVKKCIYSDLDFILLGWLIEEKLGMPLDEAAHVFIFAPLKLKHTFFLRHGSKLKTPKKSFAPTERHKTRGLIQKSVFDDNAWSMGGVSGHAGLFSTLEDVSHIGQEFLKIAEGSKKGLWDTFTFQQFSKRFTPKNKGDWGLGFSIPSRPVSTGGRKISTSAFGHTGYPGTSLWIDLTRKTVVTVLSNRTFPTRKDERFLELRRNIHDLVWEMIDGKF